MHNAIMGPERVIGDRYDDYLAEEHSPQLSPEENEAPADALRKLRLEDKDSWWLQVCASGCRAIWRSASVHRA